MFPRKVLLMEHIRHNHYPPPANVCNVVKACELALDSYNAGNPDAVVCKVNGEDRTASQIMTDWHLFDTAFIDMEVA